MTTTLYDNIVGVVEFYLGPAAPRFIDRQIENHLHKTPRDVTAQDVPVLTEWVRVSLGLITNDRSSVEECTKRLLQLS